MERHLQELIDHTLVGSALVINLLTKVLNDDELCLARTRRQQKITTSKLHRKPKIVKRELLLLKTCWCLMERTKDLMREQSRTARLWIQYLDYVEKAKQFIRAARTSDWELHLLSISKMLNLLSATGHIHYAKSARIYLQIMQNLENTHPWLFKKFAQEGLFVVRSDRYWAGHWKDLKSRGGLTRGQGFT